MQKDIKEAPKFSLWKNHKVTKKTNWRCLKKWQEMLLIHTTEYLVRKLMQISKIICSNSCVLRPAKRLLMGMLSPFLDIWEHIKFWHFTVRYCSVETLGLGLLNTQLYVRWQFLPVSVNFGKFWHLSVCSCSVKTLCLFSCTYVWSQFLPVLVNSDF